MICHVHSGLETCDGCEPGLVVLQAATAAASSTTPALKEDLEKARKRELKQIRQKFGLKLHDVGAEVALPDGYQDRAEVRRQKVGIDPVGAKTEQASVRVPIAKKNKGFQMLAKMGWNEGEALGKTETADAITQPVKELRFRAHHGHKYNYGFVLLDLGGNARRKRGPRCGSVCDSVAFAARPIEKTTCRCS